MTAADLRALFERRDTLGRQLAAVDAQIAAACRDYADASGCRVIPRPEIVRRMVGA